MATSETIRRRYIVRGVVQGVGFRPHVYQLAAALHLAGYVVNTSDGVLVEVEGLPASLDSFAVGVTNNAPPLARIESCVESEVAATGECGFEIRTSVGGAVSTLVSPDVATCADCLHDIANPADRRFGYAFTNCTNCGPRYTIVKTIPYDRPNTTMASFLMCAECRAEYDDPTDRRFHAQPVCCPVCGPELSGSIRETADALLAGEIIAVKGIGGYHLATLASSERAVALLRARKHREDKPFAVMTADVASASRLCAIDGAAQHALESHARPIVLLPRLANAPVAASVAPGTGELGVMLAYSPLHHLLLAAVGQPIVLTSANHSDEPIAFQDDDAHARLASIADRFLTHNRPIHMRVDDSVVRMVDSSPYLLRRSRGYAPLPIAVPWPIERPVLAVGAELKSTIALGRDRRVFLSHHIGDLKNYEAYQSFRQAIDHVGRLFEITPQIVAHDLHPDYLSTAYALELEERGDAVAVAVQHHHAHVASCLADNGVEGPVIGVAFDGTGYGTDGTIWGGEFLIADRAGFQRAGWLAPVPLPGGDAATNEPWRMAAAYLDVLGETDRVYAPELRWHEVVAMARAGVNSPLTSSVGRLFDAVAATIGLRRVVNYEAQAAVELEAVADRSETVAYPMSVEGSTLVGADLIAAALADHRAGVGPPTIAARFHLGLAAGVRAMCRQIRDQSGLQVVALSGGVFANVVLLREVSRLLTDDDFTVLRHHQVPCNDGGICLGQAVVASAQLAN